MSRFFSHSLSLRVGLAMAGILLLTFGGLLNSFVMAELLKGQAAAINQAGSLRMQSFAITTRLLAGESAHHDARRRYGQAVAEAVQEFERRLASPRLTGVLPRDPGHRLRAAYARIAREWDEDLKPLASVYLYNAEAAARGEIDLVPVRDLLLRRIFAYVEEIDRFVSLLEEEAEEKIARLRLVQGSLLLATLAVVVLTLGLMYARVLVPLRELLSFAARARRGDLSVRVRRAHADELGELTQAFNVMAEDLSRLYRDLETRVAQKTADLERSHRNLKLLYDTTRRLNEAPVADATYKLLLKDLERALGLGPGAICVRDPAHGRSFLLASTFRPGAEHDLPCPPPPAADREVPDAPREAAWRRVRTGAREFLAVPLRDQEQNHGWLLLEVPLEGALDPAHAPLLEAVWRHIGLAIGNLRRGIESRRLALLEERAVIARELHDSLAQSLSYLKIQVSRLQQLAERSPRATAETAAVLEELRTGLNNAYRQLRELLTTFRLKMDGRGLAAALADTVEEFRQRSGLAIALEYGLTDCPLSVNEEINILQIVREALSNVARHARANHASVRLAYRDGRVTVTVEDDGVGLGGAQPAARAHHYGLAIMQERARALGGELEVAPRRDGDGRGTRVALRFVAARRRQRPAAAALGGETP
jgi:two-component system nitrate/nitrite sensor histidine kinase NarX